MSDTPRTNALLESRPITAAAPMTTMHEQASAVLTLCRELERELAEAKEEIARLMTPPLWITLCAAHKDIPWCGTFTGVHFRPPGREVCPICHPEEMKILMEANRQ